MWYLTNSAGDLIYLKPNKELTFGRKRSDIILQSDESISRIHASIHIEPKDVIEINEPISICSLKDMGSKYGTYVFSGDKQIEVTKEKYVLKNKDKIRFGLQQHIFAVTYVPIITVVSTLNDSEKNVLHNLMEEIDGMISTDWTSSCTHLTVSKATLTEKVTWAMASALPIVTVKYWEYVKDAFENGKEIPDPNNFVPPISEGLINRGKVSLSPNEKRKTLFKNLIFVHFSARQYKTYGKMINMAGGKSVLYTKRPLSSKDLCAPNVVVLQYSSSDATQSTQCIVPEYDSIEKLLQANKRRMVPESEIPLAILHCSIGAHCNPKFNFANFLKRSYSNRESSEILALDTQDVPHNTRPLPKIISNVALKSEKRLKHIQKVVEIIPETCDTLSTDSMNKDRRDDSKKEVISTTQTRRYIPETEDTVYDTESFICESNTNKSNGKAASCKKDTVFIPETNDSFDERDNRDERSIESFLNIVSSLNAGSVKQLGESVTISRVRKESASKSSPPNHVYIAETNDSFDKDEPKTVRDTENVEGKESTPKQSANTEIVEHSESFEMFKLSPAKNIHENRGSEPHTKPNSIKISQNLTMEKEPAKICKDSNIIDLSVDNDDELEQNTQSKTCKDHEKQSQREAETTNKSNTNVRRRSDSTCISDDDEFVPRNSKRICLNDSDTNIHSKSSEPVSFKKDESLRNANILTKSNFSFLRDRPGAKTFEKVYKNIPKKRITLQDMYLWKACNVRMS